MHQEIWKGISFAAQTAAAADSERAMLLLVGTAMALAGTLWVIFNPKHT